MKVSTIPAELRWCPNCRTTGPLMPLPWGVGEHWWTTACAYCGAMVRVKVVEVAGTIPPLWEMG